MAGWADGVLSGGASSCLFWAVFSWFALTFGAGPEVVAATGAEEAWVVTAADEVV